MVWMPEWDIDRHGQINSLHQSLQQTSNHSDDYNVGIRIKAALLLLF